MKKLFKQAIANLRALKIPSNADPKEIESAIMGSLKLSLDIKPESIKNSISLDIEAITKAATEAVMQSLGIVAMEKRIKAAEEYNLSLQTYLNELDNLVVSGSGVLEKEKPKLIGTWGKPPAHDYDDN